MKRTNDDNKLGNSKQGNIKAKEEHKKVTTGNDIQLRGNKQSDN